MGNEKNPSSIFGVFLFPKIFRTFRIATQPSNLIIAFSALALICLAGWVMDISSNTVVTTPGEQEYVTELEVHISNPDYVESFIDRYAETGGRTGVYSTLWSFGSEKFHIALSSLFAFNLTEVVTNIADYFRAVGWVMRYHPVYCIIFFVLKLAVISIAGGSICRITSLQIAKGEKIGLSEAIGFSTKRLMSFFTAPLVPVVIITLAGLCIFLLGLIGNIPVVGELIIGISMPLILIGGGLIAIVLIGTVAGFNLMFPAIAYDGSDCFDAISRSFSYVYSKPWWMGFYTAIAAVYGAICYTFVRFFVFLLLRCTHQFLQFGVWVENSSKEANKLVAIWPTPSFVSLLDSSTVTVNWSESFAILLVQLFLLIVIGLVVSFVISFYFSANTIIYSLMRKKVDNTALEDIYTYLDEVETESPKANPKSKKK